MYNFEAKSIRGEVGPKGLIFIATPLLTLNQVM